MRPAEGLYKAVRNVPDMFQDAGAPRTNSRGDEIELVEVNHVD